MSEANINDGKNAECESKPRARPTLALYKPPVLRGEQPFLPKKTEKVDPKTHLDRQKLQQLKLEADAVEFEEEVEFKTLEKEEQEAFYLSDFEEIIPVLRKQIDADGDGKKIGTFIIDSVLPDRELVRHIAEFLVKYYIEDSHGGHHKQHARRGILTQAFMTLASTQMAAAFCHGVTRALGRYFECRQALRTNEEYSSIWLNFIGLTFEFAQIAQEDNLMRLIFQIFEYLLDESIINTVKIAELEQLLSVLMIIGRRIEQEYPDHLGQLRAKIRDAFLAADEAWTRKMLMIMVELGAGGEWKMTADLEEYYFR